MAGEERLRGSKSLPRSTAATPWQHPARITFQVVPFQQSAPLVPEGPTGRFFVVMPILVACWSRREILVWGKRAKTRATSGKSRGSGGRPFSGPDSWLTPSPSQPVASQRDLPRRKHSAADVPTVAQGLHIVSPAMRHARPRFPGRGDFNAPGRPIVERSQWYSDAAPIRDECRYLARAVACHHQFTAVNFGILLAARSPVAPREQPWVTSR